MEAVLRHIGNIHAHQAGFKAVCGINGCPRSYTNFSSFRKHLYRNHSETVEPVDIPGNSSDNDSEFLTELDTSSPAVSLTEEEKLKRSLTLFIMKNKEIRQLSQIALNELLSDISLIFNQLTYTLSSRITATINESGLDSKDITGL